MQGEDIQSRRKRLCMLASQRGMLEVELCLAPLVKERLTSLDGRQLDDLERLLAMEDLDLWEVICGRRPVPFKVDEALWARLRGGLGPAASRPYNV